MDELRRLEPGAARTARELVEGLALDAPRAGRPRVVAAMIASADGRAAVEGRSVGLGHPADRALLRELRTGVDAILVGIRTLEAERYATLLDADQRARRAAQGRPEHPIVATISRTFALPLATPIFGEPGTPILVATESDADAPDVAAPLEVERFAPGTLDVRRVLEALGHRGVRSVLCEGGPRLLRELVVAGSLDDLLLTVAPLLVAGHAPGVLEGDVLPRLARLELLETHRAGDHMFLHYAVGGAA